MLLSHCRIPTIHYETVQTATQNHAELDVQFEKNSNLRVSGLGGPRS
jgi:hypothetical protein